MLLQNEPNSLSTLHHRQKALEQQPIPQQDMAQALQTERL
jgi:hypothetical protein